MGKVSYEKIVVGKVIGDNTYGIAKELGKFSGTSSDYTTQLDKMYQTLKTQVDVAYNQMKTMMANVVRYKEVENADSLSGYNAKYFDDLINTQKALVNPINLDKITSFNEEVSECGEEQKLIQDITEKLDQKADIDRYIDWNVFFAHAKNSRNYHADIVTDDTTGIITVSRDDYLKSVICSASTNNIVSIDNFDKEPLFQHWDVNAYVDEDGFKHITAIEGDDNFDRYNKDTYVMYPTWYISIDNGVDYISFTITGTDTTSEIYGNKNTGYGIYKPFPAAINPDGSVSPFMLFPKYMMDEQGRTVSGQYPKSGMNYDGAMEFIRKTRGNQYSTTNTCDVLFVQLLMILKYGTVNSQSIMRGVTSYDYIVKSKHVESNTNRIIVTDSDSYGFSVGSSVMVGLDSPELDNLNSVAKRSHYLCSCIARHAQITAIEEFDSSRTAIYLDIDHNIDVTENTTIITDLWKTGMTDIVPTSDGSFESNTVGKYPCKIGGIEIDVGSVHLLNLMVEMKAFDNDTIGCRYYFPRDCRTIIPGDINTYRNRSDQIIFGSSDTLTTTIYPTRERMDIQRGSMYPTKYKPGGTNIGFNDRLYYSPNTSGEFSVEWLGALSSGSNAGFWRWNLDSNPNVEINWYKTTMLSCNGVHPTII